MTRSAWSVAVGLVVVVWVAAALLYFRVPDRVPTHWNLRGEVDGFGPRSVGLLLLPATMTGLLGLFAVLPWMSPPSFKLDGFRSTYGIIVVIALVLLALIHALTLLAALGYHLDMTRWIMAAALLALGLMGNFFGKVQRNFYVGFRVPWTLASERVWNETHRLAAWITCGCGLVGSAVALAGHPLLATTALVPIVAVPLVFSLVRYKQLEAQQEV